MRIALAAPTDLLHLRGRLPVGPSSGRRSSEDEVQVASDDETPAVTHPNAMLRVGAFAAARFTALTGSVPWAPEAAVRYDTDGASVMVLEADNRVRKTAIKTGAHSDGFVQLLAGPPPGSQVLLGAAAFVVDGEAVQPIRASPLWRSSASPPGPSATRFRLRS